MQYRDKLRPQFRDPREYVPRRFCIYCGGELPEYSDLDYHPECEPELEPDEDCA